MEEKSLIISQMKYFSKHLGGLNKQQEGDTNDIIDIQVSCDSVIFQFLLDYCKEIDKRKNVGGSGATGKDQPPVQAKLTIRLLFPVFVSSEFLKIDKLVTECLTFWKKNFA